MLHNTFPNTFPNTTIMKIVPANSEGCWIFIFVIFCHFFRHLVLHAFAISILDCHFCCMYFCILLTLFFWHCFWYFFTFFCCMCLHFCRFFGHFLIRRGWLAQSRPRKSKHVILPAHESFWAFSGHFLIWRGCLDSELIWRIRKTIKNAILQAHESFFHLTDLEAIFTVFWHVLNQNEKTQKIQH